jgi:plasmid stabilization system protein ParE
MPLVVKLPLAETDLEEIWWYIAQDNPDAADRFLEKIEEPCSTLANFPQMGRAVTNCTPVFAACRLELPDLLLGG